MEIKHQSVTNGFVNSIPCNEPTEFLSRLRDLRYISSPLGRPIFRGLPNADWKLIPSAWLPAGKEKLEKIHAKLTAMEGRHQQNDEVLPQLDKQTFLEMFAVSAFYTRCNMQGLFLPHLRQELHEALSSHFLGPKHSKVCHPYVLGQVIWPQGGFEQVTGLAQHYGIPTRVLDWSLDPQVAAYFACKNYLKLSDPEKSTADHIAVWVAVSSQIDCLSVAKAAIPSLNHEVRLIECAHFGNPNLAAQTGVFTIATVETSFGTEIVDFVQVMNSLHAEMSQEQRLTHFRGGGLPKIYKLTLPSNKSSELLKELSKFGCDSSTLFPGHKGSVSAIEEQTYDW